MSVFYLDAIAHLRRSDFLDAYQRTDSIGEKVFVLESSNIGRS